MPAVRADRAHPHGWRQYGDGPAVTSWPRTLLRITRHTCSKPAEAVREHTSQPPSHLTFITGTGSARWECSDLLVSRLQVQNLRTKSLVIDGLIPQQVCTIRVTASHTPVQVRDLRVLDGSLRDVPRLQLRRPGA